MNKALRKYKIFVSQNIEYVKAFEQFSSDEDKLNKLMSEQRATTLGYLKVMYALYLEHLKGRVSDQDILDVLHRISANKQYE